MSSFPINDTVTPVILIYEHCNYKGRTLVLTGNQANFVTIGFNDKASSAIILKGSWQLFEHIDFNGKALTLHPGQYDNLHTLGNDTLSSVKLT